MCTCEMSEREIEIGRERERQKDIKKECEWRRKNVLGCRGASCHKEQQLHKLTLGICSFNGGTVAPLSKI